MSLRVFVSSRSKVSSRSIGFFCYPCCCKSRSRRLSVTSAENAYAPYEEKPMAQIHERHEFNSWELALAADALTPAQLAVLQELVDEGKVADLQTAAQFLDWQGEVLDGVEHLYGH